jgi:uroporphyrinogen decarboxylase
MRQAGRSLPEYRAIRERAGMFEIMRDPALTAEVTLQPVRRLGVDAAILFSDIVAPLAAIGVDVDIEPGVGPVFGRPVRSHADLAQLRPLEADEDMPWVAEAVRILVADLKVPLIGFAGAPFTVASYLVEGGPSRTYANTKTLASLRAQVAAGASAVQVFDSWAGTLSAADYRDHVLPSSRRIFDGLADLGVPRIHFGVGTGELLGLLGEAGADVVGVDWRVPIDEARRRVGPGKAVQGNLDPVLCLAPWDVVAGAARDVLAHAGEQPGHIFNLGHGVLPETDPDTLARLVDLVHAGD